MTTNANQVQDGRGSAGDERPRIGVGTILAFVMLACALAWAVALPLWLGDGLEAPYAKIVLSAMMYTPALAVLIVLLVLRPIPRGARPRYLGIWPPRPVRRVVWLSVLAVVATGLMVFLSVLVAGAFGWIRLDFAGLSGFTELLASSAPEGTTVPPAQVMVLAQLAQIPIAAVTVNALAAFGEEVGWRGFLLPALRRFGTWPALLISGAIWGLWHTPVILLGYNFGRTDSVGVLAMVACGVVWGVLFGWLRLRSGSIWPAVFAHSALNASAGMSAWFILAGTTTDPVLSSPLGVAGWIVAGVVILALLVTGQFRPRSNEIVDGPRGTAERPRRRAA